ncbi:MAG: hypothetical protein H7A34_01440 [bacterium]|nr:hypothetical protein [bacterium]
MTQCPEVHGSILDAPPVYSYGLNVYVAGLQLDVIESVGTTLVLGDSFFLPYPATTKWRSVMRIQTVLPRISTGISSSFLCHSRH